jgi:hypothetical protein
LAWPDQAVERKEGSPGSSAPEPERKGRGRPKSKAAAKGAAKGVPKGMNYNGGKDCMLRICAAEGKAKLKVKGDKNCQGCKNIFRRAKRVAVSQDCGAWFELQAAKVGDPSEEGSIVFREMMEQFDSECPSNGRGDRTGLFDFFKYSETKTASTGMETWSEGEWMTEAVYIEFLKTDKGGKVIDPSKSKAKWNSLKNNNKLKAKFDMEGNMKLPVIVDDKFKFYNRAEEQHILTKERKAQKRLTTEEEEDLEAEMTSGHSRFMELNPLAGECAGALEESGSMFAPNGRGMFVEGKAHDASAVQWLMDNKGADSDLSASKRASDEAKPSLTKAKLAKGGDAGSLANAAVVEEEAAEEQEEQEEEEQHVSAATSRKRLKLSSAAVTGLQKQQDDAELEAKRLINETSLMRMSHGPSCRYHNIFSKYFALAGTRLQLHSAMTKETPDELNAIKASWQKQPPKAEPKVMEAELAEGEPEAEDSKKGDVAPATVWLSKRGTKRKNDDVAPAAVDVDLTKEDSGDRGGEDAQQCGSPAEAEEEEEALEEEPKAIG